MQWFGYIASILIGVSLGLIGGGGSILTIPVLVYLFKIPPAEATGYSLFIVGCTSLTGAFKNYLKGFVNLKIALSFSMTATVVVLVTRTYFLRIIPENLFTVGNFVFIKSVMIMMIFAIVMLVAAFKMIFVTLPETNTGTVIKINYSTVIFTAIGIGFLTGLLGAGGGFLIIPALVFLFHIPVKKAIGTSLLIIAVNSLFGFAGDLFHLSFNWHILITVTVFAIGGMLIGTILSERINGDKLKKGFGWFVLVMGIYILAKEIMNM